MAWVVNYVHLCDTCSNEIYSLFSIQILVDRMPLKCNKVPIVIRLVYSDETFEIAILSC